MVELLKPIGILIAVSIALMILFRVGVWIQDRKTERVRARWEKRSEPKSDEPMSAKQPKQPTEDTRKAAKRWTGVDF